MRAGAAKTLVLALAALALGVVMVEGKYYGPVVRSSQHFKSFWEVRKAHLSHFDFFYWVVETI